MNTPKCSRPNGLGQTGHQIHRGGDQKKMCKCGTFRLSFSFLNYFIKNYLFLMSIRQLELADWPFDFHFISLFCVVDGQRFRSPFWHLFEQCISLHRHQFEFEFECIHEIGVRVAWL